MKKYKVLYFFAAVPTRATWRNIPEDAILLSGVVLMSEPPVRPIVSSTGSPCYALAGFLHKILSPLAGRSESFVNSAHFIQL
jgi:hypothetical protein